jgi:hypothetical protein
MGKKLIKCDLCQFSKNCKLGYYCRKKYDAHNAVWAGAIFSTLIKMKNYYFKNLKECPINEV